MTKTNHQPLNYTKETLLQVLAARRLRIDIDRWKQPVFSEFSLLVKNILHLSYVLLKLLSPVAWSCVSMKTETGCGRKWNTIVSVGGNNVSNIIKVLNLKQKESLKQLSDFSINVESSDELKWNNVEHVQAALSRHREKQGLKKKLTVHSFCQRLHCTWMSQRWMAVLGRGVV